MMLASPNEVLKQILLEKLSNLCYNNYKMSNLLFLRGANPFLFTIKINERNFYV